MKFSHVAISVNDIETSRKFYEELLGLKFKTENEKPELGVKFVMLEDEDGTIIELLNQANSSPQTQDYMDFSKIGLKHIAFTVKDLAATKKKLEEAGVKILWENKKGIVFKQTIFVSDPDNIAVEIVELK
jgi:methylmalonyl-CoA epimerase